METHENTFQLRQAERQEIKIRGPIITELAVHYLQNTALIQERPLEEEDLEQIKEFYIAAAPYAHPKVFPDLWDHLLLASLYGKHLAGQVKGGGITPLEAQAIGLLQDIGSLLTPHRYYRKDVVDKVLERRLQIRPDLRKKFIPLASILGRFPTINSLEEMTLPQIESYVADNLSKLDSTGKKIRTMEESQEATRRLPRTYSQTVFTTERWGLKALTEGGKQQLAIDLLDRAVKWLENEHGVDFEELRKAVWEDFQSDKNQKWLLAVKDAQETLNPQVDEKLDRPAIKTIVFDIGGVLINDADPALIEALASHFNTSKEAILSLFDDFNTAASGNKITEEKYLRRFYERLDEPFPQTIEETRAPFVHPEIYQPIEGMQELVRKLSENQDVQILFLSDSIHAVTPILLEEIRKLYPQIKPENILVSCQIGAAKGEEGAPAFKKLLERLENPAPQTVLFIDDKPRNTTSARACYNLRSMNFRDTERLRNELEKAALLK